MLYCSINLSTVLRYSLILGLIYTLCSNIIVAQDLHYSQFFNSPLNLSPSMTGYFNGEARYHLNYRNQWANVPVDYVSATVGADFKIKRQDNGNYIGSGVMLNYDMAGDLNLSLTEINLFLSYSMKISERSRISPAINLSFAQRRFDPDGVRTGNQWDGAAYNPSIPAEDLGADNRSYFDFGAGFNYRWQKVHRSYFDLGVAAYHIIMPGESFNSESTQSAPRPIRYSAYGLFNFPLSNRLDILFNGVYSRQEEYQEKVVNSLLKLYMGSRQSMAFYLGGGYRIDDAWYPMVAIEVGRVYGAFTYDFTISDFKEINDGRGGPEISLRYIVSRIPKGIDKPCPLY